MDIEPTRKWQDEIELALSTADALVAMLTPGFHESDRRIFRHRLRRRRLESTLQHCCYSTRPGHPAESEGTSPGIVAGALGFDPLVGEGHVRRSHDD
jgi:hypothetical protein